MKLKKYEKQPNNAHALKYMECLNVMTEEKGEDIELLQYTKLWIIVAVVAPLGPI